MSLGLVHGLAEETVIVAHHHLARRPLREGQLLPAHQRLLRHVAETQDNPHAHLVAIQVNLSVRQALVAVGRANQFVLLAEVRINLNVLLVVIRDSHSVLHNPHQHVFLALMAVLVQLQLLHRQVHQHLRVPLYPQVLHVQQVHLHLHLSSE